MLRTHQGRLISLVTLSMFIFCLSGGVSIANPYANSTNAAAASISNYANLMSSTIAGTVYNSAYINTDKIGTDSSGAGRTLTLQEAIDMAQAKNPEVLSVEQDVYLRESDLDKAHYFSKAIKDADSSAKDGEKYVSLLQQQLNVITDPTMKAQIQGQIDYIQQQLTQAEPYRLDTFENAKIAYLYENQAQIGVNLTKIGVKVAKQKIALLTSKQYFDVIKDQKLEEQKRVAAQRAAEQEKIAKDAYDSGFKAKDEYLLAKAQAELMRADYQKSQLDRESAEEELKATICIDQSTKIKLVDCQDSTLKPDLNKQIQQGLPKRLEVQQAQGQLEIAKLTFQIAQSYLTPGVADYDQAKINVQKAEINLAKQKITVEKEIREAYQSVMTTQTMLDGIKTTVASARESAEIAEYRYREGYGIPSPIMKALNSEDLAGTIVEVLAAQEKLQEVEEKVIEIEYNNDLANTNYLVSIGEGL